MPSPRKSPPQEQWGVVFVQGEPQPGSDTLPDIPGQSDGSGVASPHRFGGEFRHVGAGYGKGDHFPESEYEQGDHDDDPASRRKPVIHTPAPQRNRPSAMTRDCVEFPRHLADSQFTKGDEQVR